MGLERPLGRLGLVGGTVKIGGKEGLGEGNGLERRGCCELAGAPPAGRVRTGVYQDGVWSKSSSAADGADQREGLWKEAEALRVAQAWQEATGHHTRHPPLFSAQG